MQEVPVPYGFLAFPAIGGKAVALVNRLRYFATVFNGSCLLAVTGRDKDATWRTLGALCRERDWSPRRLLHELQRGLSYRTIPAGHAIDWHAPDVVIDVEASEATYTKGVPDVAGAVTLDRPTVGIEVLPPRDAEVPAPAASASARWAFATARDLRTKSKLPKGASKAELARLLETEAQKAVKAGQLVRALKASYIENQLTAWGIWPVDSPD
jgi:hypothetical protein